MIDFELTVEVVSVVLLKRFGQAPFVTVSVAKFFVTRSEWVTEAMAEVVRPLLFVTRFERVTEVVVEVMRPL